MRFHVSRLGVLVVAIALMIGLWAIALPTMAAPAYLSTITLNDIDGLDGNADADFWAVDYFDTNGRGDANDPTATMTAPPTLLAGYGATALRVATNPGTGGSGCARLGGKVFFGTGALAGTKLSELTDFGYSYLVESVEGSPASLNLTIYTNIFVDKNGDGVWLPANDTILVYEPYYTQGAPTLGTTWYDNLAIGTGANGRWHYTTGNALPGLGQFVPNTVDLWSEVIAQPVGGAGFDPTASSIGDLRIANPAPGCVGSTQGGTGVEGTGNGLVMAVGQKDGGPWSNYVAYLDAVYLTATGANAVSRIDNLNVTGDPVTANTISGGNQSTPINTAFAPLVLELRDVNNALVENGTQVTISVPGAGASANVTPLTATVAGGNGRVTFNATANGNVGGYPVNVTNFLGATVTGTTFTNTAATPATTVLVFPQDVNGLAGDNTDFWNVDYYDTNPSADNPVGTMTRTVNSATNGGYASFQFYVGEEAGTLGGNPPGCTGSGGKTFFGTTQLAGLTLRDLDELSFSEMISALGLGDVNALLPYVNIFFDMNDDGQWLPADDGILVFNGSLGAPYTLGQWYDTGNLTASGSTRLWNFAVKSPLAGNFGLNSPVLNYYNMIQQSVRVDVLGGTTVGDLKIVNPVGGCNGTTATEGTGNSFTFVFGQKNGGSYNGMVAHIDSITLATSGGGALDIGPTLYDLTDYGAPTTITATSGSGQNTAVSTAFTNPLVATVTDALGNTVPNLSVAFTVPGAGASAIVSSPLITDLLTGAVSSSASANATVGSYVVTANITPPLTAASFNLSNGAVPPTAPSNLMAALNAPTSIDLTWTTTANAGLGDQQDVQRSVASANVWSTLATLGAPAQTYTDSGACSDSFDYRIRVFNGAGEAFSNIASMSIPACPSDIAISAGDGQSAVINTPYGASLVVYVSDSSNNPVSGALVTFTAPMSGASVTFPSGNTNVTDVNGFASVPVTANGTPGMVTVAATTATVPGGLVLFSLTNTPSAPVAVMDLTATAVSASNINLAWTSTSTSGLDSYLVYRAPDGVTFSQIATLPAGSATYADSGLLCNFTYTYRVDLTNSNGTATGNTASALTNTCNDLLVNGSFNADAGSPQTVPTGWTGKSLSKDAQRCGDVSKSFDGLCYLAFKGNAGEKGRFIQNIDVSGLGAGQTLTLTASANVKRGAKGLIEMVVIYPTSLRVLPPNAAKSQLRWESNTANYTTQSVSHTLVDTPEAIIIRIRSRAQTGKWFVDGISLNLIQ